MVHNYLLDNTTEITGPNLINEIVSCVKATYKCQDHTDEVVRFSYKPRDLIETFILDDAQTVY